MTYKTPVYRMTMNWKGAPMTTLESTGNAVRAPVEKAVRQSYGNNYSNSLLTVDDDGKVVVSDEFAVALNNSTGAGLTLYSEIDTIKNTYVSQANLAASVDGVAASLTLIATKSELGKYATVASLTADNVFITSRVTTLESAVTTINGVLNIRNGVINANSIVTNGLGIENNFYLHDEKVNINTLTYVTSFTQASGQKAPVVSKDVLLTGTPTSKSWSVLAGRTVTF